MKSILHLLLFFVASSAIAQTLPLSGTLFNDSEPVSFETIEFYDFNQDEVPTEPVFTVTTDENGEYSTELVLPQFFDLEYYSVETSFCDEPEALWAATYSDETGEFETIIVNVLCNGPQPGEVAIQAIPVSDDNLTWMFSSFITGEIEDFAWQIEDEPFFEESIVYTFENSGIFPVFLTVNFANGTQSSVGYDVGVGDEDAYNCNAAFYPVLDSLEVGTEILYFENYSVGTDLEYLWDFGDGNTSINQFPTHVFDDDFIGSQVCLTVSNDAGCVDVDCVVLVDEIFNGIAENEDNGEPVDNSPKNGGTQMVVLAPELTVLNTKEQAKDIDLKLFPNPCATDLTVSFDAPFPVTIKITDLTGSVILESDRFKSGQSFDFHDYPSGMYLIKVGSEVRRVVKN